MAETTHISWADATLNFWIGCTKVSPACDFCYAETWGNRFGVPWGVGQPRRRTVDTLAKARGIERRGKEEGRRLLVFSNSLADIFDKEVPIEWLRDAFAVMRATPGNVYLLLTKRPGLIVERAATAGGLPENAAIGCTVVSQGETREVMKLLAAKAALNAMFAFVSVEPMLGPVDLTRVCVQPQKPGSIRAGIHVDTLKGRYCESGIPYLGDWDINRPPPEIPSVHLDWVIVGGESGTKARPMAARWARDLRDACACAGVPFHFKQWGEWAPGASARSGDPGRFAFGDYEHAPDEPLLQVDFMPRQFDLFGARALMTRVGKAAAGDKLDGRAHHARPVIA